MGLDATVYCDCLERGRLRSAPRQKGFVHTDVYGSRSARTGSLEGDLDFDHWNISACEHEDGVLLHHWLGNAAGVGTIRQSLSTSAQQFPLILSKIVYSGIHSGDFLSLADLSQLAIELKSLRAFHATDAESEAFVRRFEQQLGELLLAAQAIGKPITF